MKYILECEKIEATPNIELKRLLFKDGYTYLISSRVASHITPYDEESAYQKGRYAAQEVYRRMTTMFDKSYGDYLEIFDVKTPMHVIRDYTVDEIEQMLDEYEKRIRVGDEVVVCDRNGQRISGEPWVVKEIQGAYAYGFGRVNNHDAPVERLAKTGRHFDEMETIMKKLKG